MTIEDEVEAELTLRHFQGEHNWYFTNLDEGDLAICWWCDEIEYSQISPFLQAVRHIDQQIINKFLVPNLILAREFTTDDPKVVWFRNSKLTPNPFDPDAGF